MAATPDGPPGGVAFVAGHFYMYMQLAHNITDSGDIDLLAAGNLLKRQRYGLNFGIELRLAGQEYQSALPCLRGAAPE